MKVQIMTDVCFHIFEIEIESPIHRPVEGDKITCKVCGKETVILKVGKVYKEKVSPK